MLGGAKSSVLGYGATGDAAERTRARAETKAAEVSQATSPVAATVVTTVREVVAEAEAHNVATAAAAAHK